MQKTKEDYYQSLYQLAETLNSSHVPQVVLQSIVEGVAKAMEAKGCSLMLLSPDRKVLLHTVAYGLSDWYVKKGPVSADRSISEALDGKAIAVYDATEDHRVQYREQARKKGSPPSLPVPMELRESIIGVIRVYTQSGGNSAWMIRISSGQLPTWGPLLLRMRGCTSLFKKTTRHSERKC